MDVDSQLDPAEIDWVPFPLTHVEFPKGDLLGKIFAIASLMPMAVISGFVTLILFRRDLHTITFFAGFLCNEVVNMILKYTIRQSRPMHRNVQYTEFGMPSSHSQNMWFFASYCVLFVVFRMHRFPGKNAIHNIVQKLGIIFSVVVLATLVAYSRIYLLYHTWAQILWGAFMGCLFAGIWFTTTHFVLAPRFQEIVSWPICEYLLIRDTSLIPNILWFEYANARQESRNRARKMASMKSQ